MNLNPVVKFDIDCPVPAEQVRQRLLSVTEVRSPLIPDWSFSLKDDSRRYAGKILEDRFRIRTRPRMSLQTFLFHTHRQIVIQGRLEPRGPHSRCQVLIRPMIGVLAGWLAVMAGLILILARVVNGTADLVDWIFLAFFAVWVYTSVHIYISSHIVEKAFLEKLLGSPAQRPLPASWDTAAGEIPSKRRSCEAR
ncbi:MAG: hypothetical protein JSV52_01950 [Candidatus Zixiibacteriota bacterium]|nr:MAG: hypothetical protein JSV52_01950 [candidate division Zixibacteria bacterium]